MLSCSESEHKERARRYPFCFLCGEHIRLNPSLPTFRDCRFCHKPTHVDWTWCGWCGARLKDKT